MTINGPGAADPSAAPHEPAVRPAPAMHEQKNRAQGAGSPRQRPGRWGEGHSYRRMRAAGTPMYSVLFPALLLSAVGLSTDAAPSRLQASGGRSGFVGAWSARVLGGQPAAGTPPYAALGAPMAGAERWPGVCGQQQRLLQATRPRTPGGFAHGVRGLSAQFQTDEEQQVAAKWRPPPLAGAYSDTTDADLTPSDSSSDEDGDDAAAAAQGAGAGKDSAAGAQDMPATVVVGAGALRGEQEAYSMRDVQSMKVPRLRAMCEVISSTHHARAESILPHGALLPKPKPHSLNPTA
jgi:hypothetical protein